MNMPTCLNPLSGTTVIKYLIPAFKLVPNCSLVNKPLLIYRQVFTKTASTADVERHLRSIGIVEPQWRYTMYSTDHFHSTSHEVLTIVSGRAKLCFGHMDSPDAVQEQAEKGDVILVPAGVSHRLIEDVTGDFQMVGSYPVGCSWDMCYGSEGERAKNQGISELPWLSSDPVYGQDGPAMHV